MKFVIPFLLVLSSCANVSTTKFIYSEPNGVSLTVEMPKELEAKNLIVNINAKEGTATIHADTIKTLNVETINAQANRESSVSQAISKSLTEGVVEGAMKGVVP